MVEQTNVRSTAAERNGRERTSRLACSLVVSPALTSFLLRLLACIPFGLQYKQYVVQE